MTSAFMSIWWAVCSMEVWLQVRIGVLGAISVFIVTLLCLSSDSIDAGSAGIAFSVAATVPQCLYQLLKYNQELINNTNSLERIEEYSKAPAEVDPNAIPPPEPDSSWPNFGRVEMHGVWARYDTHLPWVLKGIKLVAEPGTKVGILGRTGSGKSSTVSALLRLLPIDRGAISIDGVDINHVPLVTLRSKIAVCPQEPVLFSGTVRFNLDPLNQSTDAAALQVLAALQQGLETTEEQNQVNNRHHLRLDDLVSPGGHNMSAGQRQVISLARAILSKPKLLLLDEATADTDHVTDATVQRVLKQLQGCTVITVAHRLRTIIHYDKVVIMGKGEVIETGSPSSLIQDPSSQFSQMCAALGSGEVDELRLLAGLGKHSGS